MAVNWLYILLPLAYALYAWCNDQKLKRLPPEAAAHSPERWSDKFVMETNARVKQVEVVSLLKDSDLPPKTGRRYIVVGGVSHAVSHVHGPLSYHSSTSTISIQLR